MESWFFSRDKKSLQIPQTKWDMFARKKMKEKEIQVSCVMFFWKQAEEVIAICMHGSKREREEIIK